MDVVKKPYVAAISGVKNSGKTTFLEKMIQELTTKGYRVAVIKHDAHDFKADVERTDTYRLRQAGAYGCGIFSPSKWMVVKEQADISEVDLIKEFPEADIILLEGFKNSSYPKFEIIRRGIFQESVCRQDTLLALLTDTGMKVSGVPSLGLEDIDACVDILEREIERQQARMMSEN